MGTPTTADLLAEYTAEIRAKLNISDEKFAEMLTQAKDYVPPAGAESVVAAAPVVAAPVVAAPVATKPFVRASGGVAATPTPAPAATVSPV